MKTILILYSCIIFFSLQIYSAKAAYPRNRLHTYLQYIQTIQNEIQNKIDGLRSRSVFSILNTQFIWAIMYQIAFNEIELRISGVSNDIRKYIYSAVGNATGLEHCYNKQHVEFEEVKNKTLLVYYACEAASLVQLSVPTAEMVQIAQIGKLAIEELGKIISSCTVSRSPRAQEGCIFGILRRTKPFVYAFTNKYKIVSRIRRKKSQQISKNFENCLKKHTRPLQNRILEIGKAAVECIRNFEKELISKRELVSQFRTENNDKSTNASNQTENASTIWVSL
uniref:Venom protein n=1 Tax=Ampulex compressa TaxID=860918 RepID=A0A1W6EW62_AMPCP|nr:venom protein [Ampulex compressa]